MRFSEQGAGVDRRLDVRSAREQRRGVGREACRVAEGDVDRAGELEERLAAHVRGEVRAVRVARDECDGHVDRTALAEDVTDDLARRARSRRSAPRP